jgi:hypothetical protein
MLISLGRKFVNLDHVREAELHQSDNRKMLDVTFTDGSTRSYELPLSFDDMDLINNFVPAPPDYFLVTYSPPDHLGPKGSTWTDPIIGFQVTKHYLRPITLTGFSDDSDNIAILLPDGKVDSVFDRTFDSRDEFRDYKDEQFEKNRKPAA